MRGPCTGIWRLLGLTALLLAGPGVNLAQEAGAANEAQEPALLIAGWTMYGLVDDEQVHGAFAEWRGRPFWAGLSPWISGGLNEGGSAHAGAGLAYGIDLGPRFRVTAAVGPAWFDGGNTLELGSTFEVFSSLELAWKLRDGKRIALSGGHVSNAGANDINPGSEFVRLGVQIPLGRARTRR